MKKVIVLNCSPRKNFNTAQLLREAERGAKSAGAETEFINLIDINYKGCISCFACKRKGAATNGLCAYQDDLRPILDKILNADAVIIGSPIYFSSPTGMFRNLLERLMFACATYLKDESTGFMKRVLDRTLPIGIIYTMNVSKEGAEQFNYPQILGVNEFYLNYLFGHAESLWAYDTYQFPDYSKYDCDMFDESHKASVKNNQFPIDKQNAFDLGKNLTENF